MTKQSFESIMRSQDPAAIAWRREQAQVDADIEGLAKDEGAAEMVRAMDAASIPLDEQRAKLISYFQEQERHNPSANRAAFRLPGKRRGGQS